MWLAIHLPLLPLQVYAGAAEAMTPLAVSEHGRLVACNDVATALGLGPGLADGAARALTAAVRILPRRPAAERAARVRLATWALGFSDQVSLDPGPDPDRTPGRALGRAGDGPGHAVPPPLLLLEAGRSLHLFGGALALHQRVAEGLAALGWRGRVVLAPTAAGAQLLAAAGRHGLVPDRPALREALTALPVAALGLTRPGTVDLAAMGLTRIGDLLRLPRAGLAGRLGPGRLDQLARLLGEQPDPRAPFTPPAHFRARLELPAEVPDAPALVFACRRLIDDLGAFLHAHQGGVQRLHWRLLHAGRPASGFALGSARPLRDPERWLTLLRGRLERLVLPAPVRAIALVSETVRPLAPVPRELPGLAGAEKPGGSDAGQPDPALLDQLRASLGEDAVRGLVLTGDHRPEQAWRWAAPGTPSPAATLALARADRPLWLLPVPQPLAERDHRPWLDGPLDLGAGAERIDTGWWDGQPVARDYYVATTPSGERLWVYRDRSGARGWFLHGRFG